VEAGPPAGTRRRHVVVAGFCLKRKNKQIHFNNKLYLKNKDNTNLQTT
jgi:hypothetical protein